MTRRPRIVHVIDSLGRGGAETLLVALLPLLAQHYEITLVTLTPETDFEPELVVAAERHCLGYTGFQSLPRCVLRLRKLIQRVQPDLVRSQLYLSGVISRAATPASIPLVFSIHNPMSQDAYEKNSFALPLERLTYRRRHALVAVSRDALADFDCHVGVKGKSFVLHNAVDEAFFTSPRGGEAWTPGQPFRLVAVGNLKEQKNHHMLVEAFRSLAGAPVSLDIYGEGPLRTLLEQEIAAHRLPVRLMGKSGELPRLLGRYDAYVMPSLYEGFGIAAAEAMAVGLPMLLSDIAVLREITHGNALFFNPADPASFTALVEQILARRANLRVLSEQGRRIAAENYRLAPYVEKLRRIYAEVMAAPPE